MANRLITLDIAKTICIILVVIGHYHPENSPVWYSLIRDVIYSFHMHLFMFASGYIYFNIISKKYQYGVYNKKSKTSSCSLFHYFHTNHKSEAYKSEKYVYRKSYIISILL